MNAGTTRVDRAPAPGPGAEHSVPPLPELIAGFALAAVAEPAFSLCVPVASEGRTLGVILVGPCEHALPQRDELARTIALITSVAIASAEVLRDQSRLAETDGLAGLRSRTRLLARAKALLQRADEALYAAKAAGRNRVSPYATPELGRECEPERVSAAVATALRADELEHAFAASEAGPGHPSRDPH